MSTEILLEPAPRDKVRRSLAQVAQSQGALAPEAPDRVFLNLKNVRGVLDAATLRVYVGVPGDQASG